MSYYNQTVSSQYVCLQTIWSELYNIITTKFTRVNYYLEY
jgi:hypothetical protein